MKEKIIPQEMQREIVKIVDEFNNEELDLIHDFYKYIAEFKGTHIYLKIKKYESIIPAARLTYSGNLNNLDFAIYKYSSEKYDIDEMFFPGVEYLDGTVKGALYACNTAYPPM